MKNNTKYELHLGDCLESLKNLPDNSVDSVITDPPYGLSKHSQQEVIDCLSAWLKGEEYKPKGKGFMGKSWDAWVPSPAVWRECLRVLKPGGHLLAFAGTRSMDLMSMSVRLAGFELRDSIGYAHDGGGAPLLAWVYGSGFPKSLDVSKAIDKAAGAEGKYEGAKTAAHAGRKSLNVPDGWDRPWMTDPEAMNRANSAYHPATEAAKQWQGWGTAMKPSWEPIILARKPLDGTVAENVLKHGTGAINVDCCRVGNEPITQHGRNASKNRAMSGANYAESSGRAWTGRWPANLIHDGSDAVMEGFPQTSASPSKVTRPKHRRHDPTNWERATGDAGLEEIAGYGDAGSAARFFFRAGHEKEDLLFCRAKAILSAWKLTKGVQPCSQENASVAESSLCLSRQAVVSVLSDAVIAASRGDRLLSDARGLSTTVTESECERLCETLITAMLISESVALPAPSQDVLIQNGCHVNVAAIQKPTDTMTITISLPKSGGYAEHVTFSIMPSSMAHGARGLNDRFRYCAKASKRDRDDGVEGFAAKYTVRDNGFSDKLSDSKLPRANHHPTVKPTALMRYLCRLVTPPNGTVLDPFTGSGSTGKAAILEGFNFIGCEMQPDYHAIAKARIEHAMKHDSNS